MTIICHLLGKRLDGLYTGKGVLSHNYSFTLIQGKKIKFWLILNFKWTLFGHWAKIKGLATLLTLLFLS